MNFVSLYRATWVTQETISDSSGVSFGPYVREDGVTAEFLYRTSWRMLYYGSFPRVSA